MFRSAGLFAAARLRKPRAMSIRQVNSPAIVPGEPYAANATAHSKTLEEGPAFRATEDSYDLKAEQSALARHKQVSGNAGSIVQYKPANRQDEAVLRRNRRIELMKPVPVERLRFKCSCGAGDARADKASKTLPVCGKACTVSGNPALSSAGCLVQSRPDPETKLP